MNSEKLIKCPNCGDQFHTTANLGEMEGCTICDEAFIIEESDIIEK